MTTVAEDRWVREYESGPEYIEHLDGVGWFDAPLPPTLHRCKPQTRAFMNGEIVKRCACGATWLMGGWIGKNETRKMRRTRRRRERR